jgi:hypothetical protein
VKAKTVLHTQPDPSNEMTIGQRLRIIAVQRAEEILSEVAPVLRHFRMFLLVVTISLPLFMLGLIVALWHLGH